MNIKSVGILPLITSLVIAVGLGACSTTELSRVADFPLSDEPLVGKFVWHDLITDDVRAAKGFYASVLGWTYEETTHPNGGDYTLLLADGRYVAGMVELDDPDGVEYSRWLPYLSVADVDQAVAVTRTAGGEAVAGPLDLPNIGRAAAIRDPQGAVLGLLRSKLGDPEDGAEVKSGHVVWNELLSSDVAESLGFYDRLAGLDQRAEQRSGGTYYFLRSQERDRAGVMLRPEANIEPVWLTHFATADVAAAAQRVSAQGGELLLAPSADFRDGRMALAVDPTGAVFVLHQMTQ